MAERTPPRTPSPWVVDNDETTISLWICQGRKMGVRGSARLTRHGMREDEENYLLARYSGDDTNRSEEGLVALLRILLAAAEKRLLSNEELTPMAK